MNIEQLKAKFPGVEIYTLTVSNRQGAPLTVHLREMDRLAYKTVSALIAKDELFSWSIIDMFFASLTLNGVNDTFFLEKGSSHSYQGKTEFIFSFKSFIIEY